MISRKKRVLIVRKWQKLAALKRKRISFPGVNTSSVANNDHVVVYTADQKRFLLPIPYLSNQIFQELLKMSEEEVGLPSNGPITLPFDAVFMEYAVSSIQKCVDRKMEEALLMSVASSRCPLTHGSMHHHQINDLKLISSSC